MKGGIYLKKIRRKWFQPNTNTSSASTFSKFTVFSNEYTSIKPNSAQTTTTTAEKSLKDILWEEIHQFKAKKLYAEALSCFSTIFEKKYADNYTFYELADIYFLMNDYTRSLKWIQKFQTAEPKNCKGFLLKAQIFLQQGKKEEVLTIINQLFSQKVEIKSEEDYQKLDYIINRLKKIFKADKLARRCPLLNDYQRKRRHILKNTQQVDKETTQSIQPVQIEGTIMPTSTQNIPSNSQLNSLLNHIWDMQSVNQEDTQKILNSSAEEITSAIMKQVLSYKKKIWLFNYLADVFRKHNNLNSALFLLRQALLLDDENDIILKNLGYLLCQNGEYKAALNTLEDIAVKDFAVLDLIQKCRNLESE